MIPDKPKVWKLVLFFDRKLISVFSETIACNHVAVVRLKDSRKLKDWNAVDGEGDNAKKRLYQPIEFSYTPPKYDKRVFTTQASDSDDDFKENVAFHDQSRGLFDDLPNTQPFTVSD